MTRTLFPNFCLRTGARSLDSVCVVSTMRRRPVPCTPRCRQAMLRERARRVSGLSKASRHIGRGECSGERPARNVENRSLKHAGLLGRKPLWLPLETRMRLLNLGANSRSFEPAARLYVRLPTACRNVLRRHADPRLGIATVSVLVLLPLLDRSE